MYYMDLNFALLAPTSITPRRASNKVAGYVGWIARLVVEGRAGQAASEEAELPWPQ
jgi:hypothetical protein